MRVPRREHRSVAFVPLAATCLEAGLSSLVICDEAVLPGVRLPKEHRPITIMFSVRGQQTLQVEGRTVICDAGTFLAMSSGIWSVSVDGKTAYHSLYVSGTGPWMTRIEHDLAAVDSVMLDVAPPAAVVTAMQGLIHFGLERPAGWDWAVLAAFSTVAGHISAVARRGGGSMVERLAHLIDSAPGEAWRLDAVATALGLTLATLNHGFRGETGEGPASWIRRRRMEHARRMLAHGQRPIAVAAALGFPDLAQFSRCFRTTIGSSPSAVQKK